MIQGQELQILAPVWLAFGLWAVAELGLTWGEAGRGWGRAGWTLGAAAMVWHLGVAFAVRHDWSHAAAVRETARQTQEIFGLRWGAGVWFNYAFVLVWCVSAIRAWSGFELWERPGALRWLRRTGFWFMWFNGAFVFARAPGRWIGLIACLAVLAAWLLEFRRARRKRPDGLRSD